jgi:hypothetical protein
VKIRSGILEKYGFVGGKEDIIGPNIDIPPPLNRQIFGSCTLFAFFFDPV